MIATSGTACWASSISRSGRGRIRIASQYASHLFQTAYRSQTARYNKLIEDIRNDVIRIEPFTVTAH